MKRSSGAFIFGIIIATFVALSSGGILLWSVMPTLGMALITASPLCLLIQLNGWVDAQTRDDSQANWRW